MSEHTTKAIIYINFKLDKHCFQTATWINIKLSLAKGQWFRCTLWVSNSWYKCRSSTLAKLPNKKKLGQKKKWNLNQILFSFFSFFFIEDIHICMLIEFVTKIRVLTAVNDEKFGVDCLDWVDKSKTLQVVVLKWWNSSNLRKSWNE